MVIEGDSVFDIVSSFKVEQQASTDGLWSEYSLITDRTTMYSDTNKLTIDDAREGMKVNCNDGTSLGRDVGEEPLEGLDDNLNDAVGMFVVEGSTKGALVNTDSAFVK